MSDDILYVVEHIEAELQRLGRLVATLRRRIEAQQQSAQAVGDSTSSLSSSSSNISANPSSGPVPHHTPLPASATRTLTRGSKGRLPAAIEESTDEEAMVRTAGGGSAYGFVRERKRDEAPPSEPAGLRDDSPLDRRTR
jgi:hypothetical protein